MNRTSILTGLGVVALGGIALVAGIALGDALDDQPTLESAAAAEQAPLAAPATEPFGVTDADGELVDGGPGEAAFTPDGDVPARDDSGVPPQGGEPGVSDETAALLDLVADVDEQAAAVAAGEAEPAPFEPPTDASEVTEDSPALHTPSPDEVLPEPDGVRPDFIDLCAGEGPGAPPPEELGCPEEGVAGTVLALISDPSSELGIELEVVAIATGSEAFRREVPSQGESWGYCDYSSIPEGEIPIYLLYSRPVEVVVEVGVPGLGEDGSTRVVEHTLEGATPEARLENIAMMIESSPEPMDPRLARSQVCLSTPPPSRDPYGLTVTATDSDGNELTTEVGASLSGVDHDFRDPPPPAEPPPPPPPPVREAEILGFDAAHARIVVPQDDPARERVHVGVVAVGGTAPDTGTETCGSIQQSVFDGSRRDRRLYNWEVTPRIDIPTFDPLEDVYELFGIATPGGGEVDPNEGLEHQTLVWLVAEDGATYDVCVWWTGNPTSPGSFVTPPIVEQRRYRVVAPDRYTVSADLVSLHLWDDTDAGQYTVELFGRRASFPPTDLPASAPDPGRRGHLQSSITEPVPLVSVNADVAYLSPLVITNEALGTQWEVAVPARVNGCDGSDEGICIGGLSHSHVFELPGEGAEITRCLGNGCSHTNLPTANMAGDATVRITYTDPDGGPEPSRTSSSWHTAERADFRGDPVVLPTTPRLDTVRTELQDPIGGFAMPSTSIRGTVVFDRPVTGEIRVDAVISPDNEACDRDPITIGPEPTQTVVVNLTGLCRDSIYSFPASVVDADGNAAEIAGRAPLAGFTRAPTVRWGFDVEVTAVHGGDAVTLEGGAFAFDDKSLAAGDDRCLQAGYHVTSPPHTTYRPVEDSLLGPTFTVGATFQLRGGCHDAAGAARTERWEAELSTDLLEALFFSAGRTQTVTVEVAGEVVDYVVRIRVEHIDRPTCTGGVCPTRT